MRLFQITGIGEIVVTAIIVGIVMLFLIILVKVLPSIFEKKIKSIKYDGMKIDDLKEMKKKNLITAQEYKRINVALLKSITAKREDEAKDVSLGEDVSLLSDKKDEKTLDPEMANFRKMLSDGAISKEEYEKILESKKFEKQT